MKKIMQYCEKCKVSVKGNEKRCPLCQGDLQGEGVKEEQIFPVISPYIYPHRGMLRLILFISMVVIAISIAMNLSFHQRGFWSVFIIAGIGSLWITFAIVVKKKNNIPKSIIWQVAVISILAFVWDYMTGYVGWSIDFVIPILCTCAMIALAVIARIMKLRIEDYIVYILIDAFFGIIPLILFFCGMITIVYPTAVCVGASIVSLSALFLFEGKALKAELIRRLHL